jgi:glycosyltransferase involved in cell wall biosynthesis
MSSDGQARHREEDVTGAIGIERAGSEPIVLFVCEWIPRYQLRFFASLRSELEDRDVRLVVVQGDPPGQTALRRDAGRLDWAIHRPNKYLPIGRRRLVWQPASREARASELVVVDQASRMLFNYWLLARQARGGVKMALLGHGANLNVARASRIGERVKAAVSRRPHWWFAYTEGARERVESLGYPGDRITVVQNSALSVDARTAIKSVTEGDMAGLRGELRLGDGPVALFLGSLYKEKRWRYLLDATRQVSARRPGFMLVIAGDGPDRKAILELAAGREDVRVVGRADGARKATLLRAADLLLMPGAVGLAVTDAFAAGIPIITTAGPTHGPEFEYLEDWANARILPASATAAQYGDVVLETLDSPELLDTLSAGARESGAVYTQEAMVTRFTDGIARALQRPFSRTGKPH